MLDPPRVPEKARGPSPGVLMAMLAGVSVLVALGLGVARDARRQPLVGAWELPGNVPVLVDRSANVDEAVAKVVEGKSFDFGTVCSSEQSIVAEQGLRDKVLAALKNQRAFLCDARQSEALAKLLLTSHFTVNAECVGQSPGKIARMAGFEAPADTSILVVEIQGVGKQHPLSAEKLSPVLSVYFVADFSAAVDACEAILRFGGLGHTAVIHATDDVRIREFALRMPAFRILVNTPAPHGSVGITTDVFPAMTLGCGAVAGNSTSDNIGPLHLINIKRIAYVTREAEEAFESPQAARSSGGIDRQMVVAAVERYLAKRGVEHAPQPITAAVVDRFLAARQGPRETASNPPPAAPSSAAVEIADFVCEDDVRRAIAQSRKIFIGSKTIVTPSARDLALQSDTLVLTERGK
jgi:acetaldehyde dehydrogenase (acetylating)